MGKLGRGTGWLLKSGRTAGGAAEGAAGGAAGGRATGGVVVGDGGAAGGGGDGFTGGGGDGLGPGGLMGVRVTGGWAAAGGGAEATGELIGDVGDVGLSGPLSLSEPSATASLVKPKSGTGVGRSSLRVEMMSLVLVAGTWRRFLLCTGPASSSEELPPPSATSTRCRILLAGTRMLLGGDPLFQPGLCPFAAMNGAISFPSIMLYGPPVAVKMQMVIRWCYRLAQDMTTGVGQVEFKLCPGLVVLFEAPDDD